MPGQIDEIKARIDIIDLISEYINLKQAGTNFRALCPFHNEKSPSFMASRDKQIFHCFGCGEGGDIFSFVQKMEGIDFAETLKILAQKAGVKLEDKDPKLSSQKNTLLDITKLTRDFWHKTLLESKQAQKARDYLKARQVSQEMIEEFKIGYAVDSWDALNIFLKNKGFKDNDIFLAGMTVKKDRGAGFYDRFRDRVMFPINDLHGNPIGFSGRTLKEDEKGGKYINSPQTLIYNKSIVLFNLDKAKQDIKKEDLAIVVEGQMDALSSYQAGVKNVIASSGTALTSDQINIIKRYTPNIAMAFDSDAAGQNAAKRGIDLAIKDELNVKVIVIPDGKDPDECIKNDVEVWKKSIKNSKSIIDYYFDEAFAKFDLSLVDGKKEVAKILLTEISKLPNRIEQTHYLQKLSDAINVPENILRQTVDKTYKPTQSTKIQDKKEERRDKEFLLLQSLLAIALKYPDNLDYLIDHFEPRMATVESFRDLYKTLIIYYTQDISGKVDDFDYQAFKTTINSTEQQALADKLVLLAEKDFFDFDTVKIKEEVIKITVEIKRNYYSKRLKEIEREIKEAELNNKHELLDSLSSESIEIIHQINLLNKN